MLESVVRIAHQHITARNPPRPLQRRTSLQQRFVLDGHPGGSAHIAGRLQSQHSTWGACWRWIPSQRLSRVGKVQPGRGIRLIE
jgi:hypothetical protein